VTFGFVDRERAAVERQPWEQCDRDATRRSEGQTGSSPPSQELLPEIGRETCLGQDIDSNPTSRPDFPQDHEIELTATAAISTRTS
jgi:hypothetical protein